MKYDEIYQVDLDGLFSNELSGHGLSAVSNLDGQFAYFKDEKLALDFHNVLTKSTRRLEMLLESIELSHDDNTSYNELELILSEIKRLHRVK